MKKLWSYLAVGFAFLSAGLIVMYKVIGEKISITVKKQRIWGRGNTMALDIRPEVESPRMSRKRAKSDKKQARRDKRIRRENKRDWKRLNK